MINQVLRITYESFSNFSNNLNRCRSFEEIRECFTVNLKYLFNYHVFRATYHRNNAYVNVVSTTNGTELNISDKAHHLGYEEILLKECRPMQWQQPDELELPACFNLPKDEEGVLWGWNFISSERHITVSVLSGNSKSFTAKDINFLKLVADNLETKLLELCLIKELDEKNALISKINEEQKETIKQRTSEIENKNKVLLEISVLNAHSVREPLSRILGLINLMTIDPALATFAEMLPRLQQSSKDLDVALQNVIKRTTADLLKLKV
ncbi:MAG: histidine kinase [Segetibacter sp.]|nr:histidine kinase [Segetibacter sp.]